MKVLITGRLPDHVLASIKKEHSVELNMIDRPMPREDILQFITDKIGFIPMITDTVDSDLMDAAPNLKIIANYGVGYNHIDIEAATKRGIKVSNTPGVLTDATADTAFALIFATARRVVEGDRLTRNGEFKFWAPMHFLGYDVSGKTLGIIGMGRIGKAVARRAAGFDMDIIYSSRTRLERSEEVKLGIRYLDQNTLLKEADFVSVHVSLNDDTHHLISTDELNLMKPSAILINTSRGPVVDEKALLEVLKNKVIYAAGLDVYENEPEFTPGLEKLDNVVLLPHVGSATLGTRTRMAEMAAENLLVGMKGEQMPNGLN